MLKQIQIDIDNIGFPPHTELYRAGNKGTAIFTVHRGKIKLVNHLPNGTLRTVRLLHQGDMFGFEALLNQPYRHSAIVVTTAQLRRIPVELLQARQQRQPELGQQLLVQMQQHLDTADQFITEFSTGSAEARVARLLLFLSNSRTDTDCELLGREEMACILGITVETASRIMADFKRRKLVVIDNGISCNLLQLRHIAQDL